MPGYLTSSNLTWLAILWPLVAFSVLLSLLIWLLAYRLTSPLDRQRLLWSAFGFSSLGMTVGLLTGDSGSSVVASVLPAVLSLVGGMAVVILARETAQVIAVSVCVSTMSLALLTGALIGMENRRIEEAKRSAIAEATAVLGPFSELEENLDKQLAQVKKKP